MHSINASHRAPAKPTSTLSFVRARVCTQLFKVKKYMNKKHLIMAAFCCLSSVAAQAGGLMTNTNYHIAFDRMFAHGATTEIDATFSNPAGLVWGHEGLELSLNFQKPWQNRDIDVDVDPSMVPGFSKADFPSKKYEGEASAPIVPALFATYHKDKWAVSGMIGIVGSGGFVEYKEGVPMYNMMMTYLLSTQGVAPGQYSLNSNMKGKQYIYGGQVNFSYKIIDCLSAAVGLRANYYDGYYRGHVIAGDHPVFGEVASLLLDVNQKGWGFTPIVSLDFHKGPLTVSARYEFRTKIQTENETNVLNAGLGTNVMAYMMATMPNAEEKLMGLKNSLGAYTAPFQDGAKTRYDMPSLLTFAVGYEFTEKLRAAVEYHWYDDKNAKMGGDRQKTLSHGTHEILAGVEYDINDKFTVSCGGQRTDYGLTDEYQQNTSFACDSYSVGLGGAWNVNDKIRLNISYFTSIYSDYEKNLTGAYGTPFSAKETYSRTNHVIGVGIDYKF